MMFWTEPWLSSTTGMSASLPLATASANCFARAWYGLSALPAWTITCIAVSAARADGPPAMRSAVPIRPTRNRVVLTGRQIRVSVVAPRVAVAHSGCPTSRCQVPPHRRVDRLDSDEEQNFLEPRARFGYALAIAGKSSEGAEPSRERPSRCRSCAGPAGLAENGRRNGNPAECPRFAARLGGGAGCRSAAARSDYHGRAGQGRANHAAGARVQMLVGSFTDRRVLPWRRMGRGRSRDA